MTPMRRHALASLALIVLVLIGAAIAVRLLDELLHPLLTL